MIESTYEPLHKESASTILNGTSTPSSNLPLTMVGKVALTKGMYLTLMKRREIQAFGNTSYSSTPRLRVSTCSKFVTPTATASVQRNSRLYSSCARIQAGQSKHDYFMSVNKNLTQSLIQTTSDSFHLDKHNSVVQDRSDRATRKTTQVQNSRLYSEIHKTRKIAKKSQDEGGVQVEEQKKSSNVTSSMTSSMLSERSTNQSNLRKQPLQRKEVKPKSEITKQPVISMRTRRMNSQLESKENEAIQKKATAAAASKGAQSSRRGTTTTVDKENQKPAENLRASKGQKLAQKMDEKRAKLQYSSMWHQEANDMETERAMFVAKNAKSRSSKVTVPGYRVKFETSKEKIYAFNCFRDKDVCTVADWRPTIDIEQDNDFETDTEQLKESVFNLFQSLCVALCEEKLVSQANMAAAAAAASQEYVSATEEHNQEMIQ